MFSPLVLVLEFVVSSLVNTRSGIFFACCRQCRHIEELTDSEYCQDSSRPGLVGPVLPSQWTESLEEAAWSHVILARVSPILRK